MPWKNPTMEERKRALVGCTSSLKSLYKQSFSPGERKFLEISCKDNSSAFFKEINNCDPSDWLLNQKEEGQSYDQFWRTFLTNVDFNAPVRKPVPAKPAKNKTICILPIGPFPTGKDLSEDKKYGKAFTDRENFSSDIGSSNPLLLWLKSYCSLFFYSANVVLLSPVSVREVACKFRVNEFTGRYQLNASDILLYLRKRKAQSQHCLVAVTMIDLFPRPSWNFVFGLASTSKECVGGVGVFSFCRYDDRFYETWTLGEDVMQYHDDGSLDYSVFSKIAKSLDGTPPRIDGMLLLRACKVMTHEVGHMFGLKHCIWMQCLMNGTNHLQESDRRPPHLCPVCLRKLQAVLNFRPIERYKALHNWTRAEKWHKKMTEEVASYQSPKITKRQPEELQESSQEYSPAPVKTHAHSYMQPTISSTRSVRSKNGAVPKPSIVRMRKTINGRPVQRKPTKPTDGVTFSTPEKGKLETILCGMPTPPLEDFSTYRVWLREAIEFIISNGKPTFVSTPHDDF